MRASDAAFLLLMTPKHWRRVDARPLLADGIEAQHVAPTPEIEPSSIRFRNAAHWNARGHRLYAEAIMPIVEQRLRALQRRRAAAAP